MTTMAPTPRAHGAQTMAGAGGSDGGSVGSYVYAVMESVAVFVVVGVCVLGNGNVGVGVVHPAVEVVVGAVAVMCIMCCGGAVGTLR